MPAYKEIITAGLQELEQFLNSDSIGVFKDVFQVVETRTQICRLNLVLGLIGCMVLIFLFTESGEFLCNMIGYIYPLCVFLWVMEQGGQVKMDTRKWITYWVVYNAFQLVEGFLRFKPSAGKMYWLIKCCALVWCFLPVTWNGSDYLYLRVFQPFVQDHQDSLQQQAITYWEQSKGFLPFVLLLLALLWGFGFLCQVFGFIFPAYFSFVSLTKDTELDQMRWLVYWVVYSTLGLFECILGKLIPAYYMIKLVLLGVYLVEPLLQNLLYQQVERLVLLYKPITAVKDFVQSTLNMYQQPQPQPEPQPVSTEHITEGNSTLASENNGVDPHEVEFQSLNPLVQAALQMGFELAIIKKAFRLAHQRRGHRPRCVEDLLDIVFSLPANNQEEEEEKSLQEARQEAEQLRDQSLCKICLVDNVEMTFSPCGHLVCCCKCALALEDCPFCRRPIEHCIRTYMS